MPAPSPDQGSGLPVPPGSRFHAGGGLGLLKSTGAAFSSLLGFLSPWETPGGRLGARPRSLAAKVAGEPMPLTQGPSPGTWRLYARPLPSPTLSLGRQGTQWFRDFLDRYDHSLQRLLEVLPGAVAWALVTLPLWATILFPQAMAYFILAFTLYWLYRSGSTALFGALGYRKMKEESQIDWHQRYLRAQGVGQTFVPWEEVHHLVIIPNLREKTEKLRRTLEHLAQQGLSPQQISVILAMEEREPGAEAKARLLQAEFQGRFAHMLYTIHPANLPGEVPGKAANEAWAARYGKRLLVDQLGYDLDKITVTSCDADALFHPKYFSCLTYHFATAPDRHRRFWQSAIMLYSNIWRVPAPVRLVSSLASVMFLSALAKSYKVLFNYSTYSASLRMIHEAGYWDVDVIPEDWHMFLKCFFAFEGKVEVTRIFLPTNTDAVLAPTYNKTLTNRYKQAVRHAWGVTDIPYTVRELFRHPEIPLNRRLLRLWALVEDHLIWSTHWFLLSLGPFLPRLLYGALNHDIMVITLLSLTTIVLNLTLIPLFVIIVLDLKLRPLCGATPPPTQSHFYLLQWALMPLTSLVYASLPALEAQTRLMLGHRLEYQVTEKI